MTVSDQEPVEFIFYSAALAVLCLHSAWCLSLPLCAGFLGLDATSRQITGHILQNKLCCRRGTTIWDFGVGNSQ